MNKNSRNNLAAAGNPGCPETQNHPQGAPPRVVWLMTVLLLLSGCFSLRSSTPAAKLYLLENSPALAGPAPSAATTNSGKGPILVVALPTATPAYDTDAMAYTRAQHQLEYFTRSRWLDKPARLLFPSLVQALRDNSVFGAVISAPSTVKADYLVNFELLVLRQDFDPSGGSRVILNCRVEMLDERREFKGSRIFLESERAATADAEGGVAAANRILNRLLPSVAEFCAGLIDD
ncbi:MAG: membrane integrity-associated transporter subunit PqiC [Deltaproteobacteria bacterium]|nr:membrane integrity-associated transporter subunit PqiC [Deltaproteobacteria bacterium]